MVCTSKLSVLQVIYIICRWTLQELEKAVVHPEWQLSVLLWIHDRQGASWYYPPREHSSTRSERSTQTSLFRAVCQWLRLHQGLQDRQRRQSGRRSVKLMLWLIGWWTEREERKSRCIASALSFPPPSVSPIRCLDCTDSSFDLCCSCISK